MLKQGTGEVVETVALVNEIRRDTEKCSAQAPERGKIVEDFRKLADSARQEPAHDRDECALAAKPGLRVKAWSDNVNLVILLAKCRHELFDVHALPVAPLHTRPVNDPPLGPHP